MVRCILWKYKIWLQHRWWWKKKTALNVKIEKLLFLFSWQNIFIAFSSLPQNFPFKWNMMYECLLYFSFSPVFSSPLHSSYLQKFRLSTPYQKNFSHTHKTQQSRKEYSKTTSIDSFHLVRFHSWSWSVVIDIIQLMSSNTSLFTWTKD